MDKMKDRLALWQALALQVVVVTGIMFIASSCAVEQPGLDVPAEVELVESSVTIHGQLPYQEVVKIVDEEEGVVCYAYRASAVAIDCIPFSQLTRY